MSEEVGAELQRGTSVDDENDEATPDPAMPDVLRQAEGGLTIREAAQRLGITEQALRGRIRRGEVEAWQTQGKMGKRWRVRLPEPVFTENALDAFMTGSADPEEIPKDDLAVPVPETEPYGYAPAVEQTVQAELYGELLERYEAAVRQLGYLQAQDDQIQALMAQAQDLADSRDRALRQIEEEREIARRAESAVAVEAEARRNAQAEAEEMQRRYIEASQKLSFYQKLVDQKNEEMVAYETAARTAEASAAEAIDALKRTKQHALELHRQLEETRQTLTDAQTKKGLSRFFKR